MKTRNHKAVLFAALIPLVAGCASTGQTGQTAEEKRAALDSWKGEDAQKLIDARGYPSYQLTAPNGNMVYIYHWENTVSQSTSSGTTYKTIYYCDTSFEIDKDQTVVRWMTQGNNCEL